MDIWTEEFLFRGRPSTGPGSELPSTFHVVLGIPTVNASTGLLGWELTAPMTPDQCALAGRHLSDFIPDINAEAVEAVLKLQLRIDDLEADHGRISAERDALATREAAARKQVARFSAALDRLRMVMGEDAFDAAAWPDDEEAA